MADIKIGMKGRYEMYVNHMVTAAAVMDGLVEVFGTPFLVMLMENASVNAISPGYAEGEGSVGMSLEVYHTSATPVGVKVWADAEVTAVDGKVITLDIKAFDEKGEIGHATHKRAVIDPVKFIAKLEGK